MSLLESYRHNGYRIEIHSDLDGSHANPREACNNGVFLGFPHRNYKIGDETIDPRTWHLDCSCESGEVTFTLFGEEVTRRCTLCEGWGYNTVSTREDLEKVLREEHNIVGPIFNVGMLDHSGVSYYIGGGAHWSDPGGWDSGTCGVIFTTRELLNETQGEGVTPSDEQLAEWLKGEIEEYSKWANGEVYGYVIKDPNGDEVDSCWGFLGWEWVNEAAKEACPEAADLPPALHTLRLTDRTLDAIESALEELAGEGQRALEIVRGARLGGDPEGQDQYASPATLEAHVPLLAAGRRATFNLTPADRKKYREQGWW